MKFLPLLHEEPPNIEQIAAEFPQRPRTVVYAYHGRIYAPGLKRISVELYAHEAVHCERQGVTEAGAIAWWDRYIEDPRFRALEELLAHRAEYQCYCRRHALPKKRAQYLEHVAAKLSGPLYHGIFSEAEAREAILQAKRAITEIAA